MKIKKVIGMLMAIIIVLLSTLTLTKNITYAEESSYILGITNIREGDVSKIQGGAYGIGPKARKFSVQKNMENCIIPNNK